MPLTTEIAVVAIIAILVIAAVRAVLHGTHGSSVLVESGFTAASDAERPPALRLWTPGAAVSLRALAGDAFSLRPVAGELLLGVR